MEDLLKRFLRHPPSLQGGIDLNVQTHGPKQLRLILRHSGGVTNLIASQLPQPYPSSLRRVLATEPEIDLVIVDHIPSGLDEAAVQAGISYLDLEGHGRIAGHGLFYFVKPSRSAGRRVSKNSSTPFAPRSSRVVRAFLADPQREWHLSELAREIGLSPGNVHRVLMALVEAGYVERDRSSYVLTDAGSLLEAWAESSRRPRHNLALPVITDLLGDVLRFLTIVDRKNVAISGEMAAEAYVPFLTAERAVIHLLSPEVWSQVEDWKDSRASFLGERDQIFIAQSDRGVGSFGSERNGLPLVSPVQVYVDLAADRGRGREAAEELRRQILQF
ncbi:hypothetical protein BH23ACT12_BH23ACT12_07100 [soil metagenome]